MSRPEGSPNKPKKGLLARLRLAYGDDFHPIMRMADIAWEAQKQFEQDPSDKSQQRIALDAWKEIAKYTEPQMKAVDITGSMEVRRKVIDMSGDNGNRDQAQGAGQDA